MTDKVKKEFDEVFQLKFRIRELERENKSLRAKLKKRLSHTRLRLVTAALNGLLADHLEHSEQKINNETCEQAVARLACGFADAVMDRL